MSSIYKILIVEDDPTTLTLLATMINSIGEFDIIACHSAREAVERFDHPINQWFPDIVMSDFMMDDGDGIDLLNYVRNKIHSDLPFIFITSASQDLVAPLIQDENNVNILSKPLRSQKIKDILTEITVSKQFKNAYKERRIA